MATVTIKNIDRLTQKLNRISNMELKETMIKATNLVHGQAKLLALVDTGNLSGSIHQEVKEVNKNIEGRVYTNLEYAPYVEFGTGIKGNGTYPYDIEGLNLSYRDSPWCYYNKDDELIWTKGQEAQPYMYPALKMHEKTIRELFKNGVRTKLKESCKGGR